MGGALASLVTSPGGMVRRVIVKFLENCGFCDRGITFYTARSSPCKYFKLYCHRICFHITPAPWGHIRQESHGYIIIDNTVP